MNPETLNDIRRATSLIRSANPDNQTLGELVATTNQLTDLLESALNRLKAVTFLVDMYSDDDGYGDVPVSDLRDALNGDMAVAG